MKIFDVAAIASLSSRTYAGLIPASRNNWGSTGATYKYCETPPSNLSPKIDASYMAFAIEEASAVEYAVERDGVTANEYSLNMFNAITETTGGTLYIRLGGTSSDYAHYSPGLEEPAVPRAEQNISQAATVKNLTIGPSYWTTMASIPNAQFVIQVPMVQTNISEAIVWAESSWEVLGDRIQSIEIGNEPNSYPNGHNGSGFLADLDSPTYAEEFAIRVDNITAALGIPSDQKIYQALDLGGAADDTLNAPAIFGAGADRAGQINQVAYHLYQTSGGAADTLHTGLMNHSAITSKLETYLSDLDYLQSINLPFIFSEVGNSLNGTHNYQYQAVLGSALWQIDWELAAAVRGVFRVHYQQIMHAGYDLWLPLTSGGRDAQTYSNFYGRMAIGDFLGSTGGCTQVAALDLSAGDATADELSQISAYGAWVDGKLVRMAVVNFNFWDSPDSLYNPANPESICTTCPQSPTDRPVINITLDELPDCVGSLTVKYMNANSGAHADGAEVTYGGQQWTAESKGYPVQVKEDTQTVWPSGGKAQIGVCSSSAVVVHFNYDW